MGAIRSYNYVLFYLFFFYKLGLPSLLKGNIPQTLLMPKDLKGSLKAVSTFAVFLA